ncbi:MAG TPA: hypothetical protein VN132_02585, partial [Bdellovibrio sp.]|nr:hypothetical protein [Bdellovibrio sp.]
MPVQQFGELLRQPKKLKKHLIWVSLTALFLSILAGLFFDQKISQFFGQPDIRSHWWPIAREITDLGLSDYYFAIAILTWAFARWAAPKIKSFEKYSARVDYYRR